MKTREASHAVTVTKMQEATAGRCYWQ